MHSSQCVHSIVHLPLWIVICVQACLNDWAPTSWSHPLQGPPRHFMSSLALPPGNLCRLSQPVREVPGTAWPSLTSNSILFHSCAICEFFLQDYELFECRGWAVPLTTLGTHGKIICVSIKLPSRSAVLWAGTSISLHIEPSVNFTQRKKVNLMRRHVSHNHAVYPFFLPLLKMLVSTDVFTFWNLIKTSIYLILQTH